MFLFRRLGRIESESEKSYNEKELLLIVPCGSVALLDCFLFGYVLPMLCLAVPLRAFLVINMSCSINPNLFVPSLDGSRRVTSRKLWRWHWRPRAYGYWRRRWAWGFFRSVLWRG